MSFRLTIKLRDSFPCPPGTHHTPFCVSLVEQTSVAMVNVSLELTGQAAHTAGAAHQRRPLVAVRVTALGRQGQIQADVLHALTVTLQKEGKHICLRMCESTD